MNGFLTKEQINIIEGIIGYTFKNKDLLSTAFRRSSITEELRIAGINLPSNETLEFYGDSVLNLIVVKANAKIAYESFNSNMIPKHNEEALSNFVEHYTKKLMLASIINELDITKYLIMGNGDIHQEANKSISVMEDLFESIVGAMWFDNNLVVDSIYDNIIRLLHLDTNNEECYKNQNQNATISNDVHIDIDNITMDNAVNKLQELFQKKRISSMPKYSTGEFDYSNGIWYMECIYNSSIIHKASAKTKAEAKKLVAYDMYMDLANRINKQ